VPDNVHHPDVQKPFTYEKPWTLSGTGDDDVPGDVLKLFGEGGLKIMTKLINNIYETGEWPKDFTEVTMIALKKQPQATKYSDHRTISLNAHTAKIVAKILRRRIEKKIEDVLGED